MKNEQISVKDSNSSTVIVGHSFWGKGIMTFLYEKSLFKRMVFKEILEFKEYFQTNMFQSPIDLGVYPTVKSFSYLNNPCALTRLLEVFLFTFETLLKYNRLTIDLLKHYAETLFYCSSEPELQSYDTAIQNLTILRCFSISI